MPSAAPTAPAPAAATAAAATPAAIELTVADLAPGGGIHCPSPQAGMSLLSSHPKVWLDVARTGQARCPYCGTVYRLAAGQVVHGGH